MRQMPGLKLYALIIFIMVGRISYAQNSVLINFGSNSCDGLAPVLSLVKHPLTDTSMVLNSCDLTAQLTTFDYVFVAYNPKNNKIYISQLLDSERVWVLDMGLPANISCPASIPLTADYIYGDVSNNFEFDNNGDLWSLSNYNSATSQCNIDKFDVTNGTAINSRLLQFPADNAPDVLASGDITILPNGRMFACLGVSTCRLYEIVNYSSTTGNATAIYLQTLPQLCVGIAYLNGMLELTGNGNGCYSYDYDIAADTLGPEKSFQNGLLPADNASISPSLGCTKRLLNATQVNDNTADLVYEVYQENLGNTILNNINLTDNLATAFGVGNISNLTVNFATGSNMAGLLLNPGYNGITDTTLLIPGQDLPNNVSTNHDYFFRLMIHCRVTNLDLATTYLNSAIARGDIGGGNPATLVSIADSSNNGDSTMVDPNRNDNAGDVGENIPTPFSLGLLPVNFLTIDAAWVDKNTALVKWKVAIPTVNANRFEVEYSIDRRSWQVAGLVRIENSYRGDYQFYHLNVPPGNIYYRIRQTDNDGTYTYSVIALLRSKTNGNAYLVYPNPADDYITVSTADVAAVKTTFQLFDATGRKLLDRRMLSSAENIKTADYPAGTYLLKICGKEEVANYKVLVRHR